MNATHDSQCELLERIHRFIVAGEGNALTESQWADFEQLILDDDEACRLYVEFMGISALLPAVMDALPDKNAFLPSQEKLQDDFSLPRLLANAFHGTVGFFSQEIPFSLLVATVVTSVGLLLGSLVYVTHHTQYPETAINRAMPSVEKPIEKNPNIVGHITGMFRCLGEGTSFKVQKAEIANLNALVSIGDRFTIASGLLEITYDTGARVILQGPCTYDVDSRDGGFLARGKLTARLEKKSSAIRRQRSTISGQPSEEVVSGQRSLASESDSRSGNPEIRKSPIPNPSSSPVPRPQAPAPVFAVRTPTATVTDLGTEFGVEVSDRGEALVQVFEGKVACQLTANAKSSKPIPQLVAGEIACITASEISIDHTPGKKSAAFVRKFPHTEPIVNLSPDKIMGYWRFEEDVPHPKNCSLISNVEENVIRDHANRWNHLNYYPGLNEGNCVPYVASSDVPPKSMFRPGYSGGAKSFNSGALDPLKSCVLFHNAGQHGYQFNFDAKESFTLEGFFKTAGNQSAAGMMAIIYKGCGEPAYLVSLNRSAHGAAQFTLFDSKAREVSATLTDRNYADGQWHYFAARYMAGTGKDGRTISLLIGNEDGSHQRTSSTVDPGFEINTPMNNLFIGRKVHLRVIEGHFRGLIDEVRISRGAISDRQLIFVPSAGKEVTQPNP